MAHGSKSVWQLPKLHGFPLLAVFQLPKRDGYREGRVILVDRGSDYDASRYVVARHFEDDLEWDHGDYLDRLDDAVESFHKRIQGYV